MTRIMKDKTTIRFENAVNHPLLKKFHMFNSGLAPISRYEENVDALNRIGPDSIRIDLFLGDRDQEFGDVVNGTVEELVYNFNKLDYLAKFLISNNIRPYWCWCYIPLPLQPEGMGYKYGPTNYEKYGEILEKLSAHYREEGIPLGFQEVFNEADCSDNLYAGTFEDFLKMYEVGAPAVKKGDSKAVVGGPAEAFYESEENIAENMEQFINLVIDKKLPLDYFSYHSYGYEKDEYMLRTRQVQSLLSKHPEFEGVSLHMNELNVIPPTWEYGTTCLTKREVVPLVWEAIYKLLTIHDVTIVHWAQLINSGVDELSLVGLDGTYYPAFYVFEIYNRMPVGRCRVENLTGLGGMASKDEYRESAVFWNTSDEKQIHEVMLTGLQSEKLDMYLLDDNFYKAAEGSKHYPLIIMEELKISQGKITIHIELQPYEVLYLEGKIKADSDAKEVSFFYEKEEYYFPNRIENDSYAELERRYNKVYLGSGSGRQEESIISIWLKDCPQTIRIKGWINRRDQWKHITIQAHRQPKELTLYSDKEYNLDKMEFAMQLDGEALLHLPLKIVEDDNAENDNTENGNIGNDWVLTFVMNNALPQTYAELKLEHL